jgi:hypothetical protein
MMKLIIINILLLLSISSLSQEVGPAPYHKSVEERDKAKASAEKWPYSLPIWAQQAVDRGYNIQLPYGISTQVFAGEQDMEIPTIGVGVNGGQMVNVSSLIELGEVKTDVVSLSLRPSINLFPFLTLYGVFGVVEGETIVPYNAITLPDQRIELGIQSEVQNEGITYGYGATVNAKLGPVIAIFDANQTFSKMERFDEPFPVATISARLVKKWEMSRGRRFTMWGGAFGTFLTSKTVGKIAVKDLSPGIEGKAAELTSARNANCNNVGGVWIPKAGSGYNLAQCTAVAALANVANKVSGSTIDYEIEKKLNAIWTPVIGGNYEFSKNWSVRSELGLITRWSIMLGAEYRFGL